MSNLDAFKLNCRRAAAFGAVAIGMIALSGSAAAAPPAQLFPFILTPPVLSAPPSMRSAPSEDEGTLVEMPARLKRQIVSYATREAPGTVIIDTPSTYLYYVLGGGRAIRYGIGVGRDGFTWSGVQSVTKKSEWPDWTPPPEMIARQPYLPRYMAGGPGNPLGARDVSRRHYLSHSRHQRAGDDRHPHFVRLHPPYQPRRHRPLFAGQRRHQGHRAADGPSRRQCERQTGLIASPPKQHCEEEWRGVRAIFLFLVGNNSNTFRPSPGPRAVLSRG
jgi:lipoprotein-anchoring transpeptidase ErfK/SrfK